MKWPSRRKSFPKSALSCTSTAWYGERKRSNSRAERTKNPQSSVRYSVMTPGAMSPPLPGVSGIEAPAPDRMELRARGLERALERSKQPLRLRRVVGRVIAHVDVDRDEAVLGPRMDREMRFGERSEERR